MSTAKSLVKNYLMMEQQPTDVDEEYPSFQSFVLGILHIFCGLFSIALGIGSICTHASGYFIAYGIWCGFIFILAGIWAIVLCVRKNMMSFMLVMSAVFSMLAACAAIVQFSLGVVAAANDRGNLLVGRLNAYQTTSIPRYDIYYSKQWDLALCKGSDGGFTWSSSWGPVDVLLLIVAFIELVVAIITVVLSFRATCCGHVFIAKQASDGSTVQRLPPASGYDNEGYGDQHPPQYQH